MASEIEIANGALSKVGAKTILSLEDDLKSARLCKLRLPQVRDRLLRAFPWSFAKKRIELAASTTSPAYEFDYAFALPSDYMRLIEIDNRCTSYTREGDYILTNNSELFIKYIRRVTDPNKMDSCFREAWAAKLAQELALSLADNQNLYKILTIDYRETISEAKNASSIESSPTILLAETWLKSRYSGSAGPEGVFRS